MQESDGVQKEKMEAPSDVHLGEISNEVDDVEIFSTQEINEGTQMSFMNRIKLSPKERVQALGVFWFIGILSFISYQLMAYFSFQKECKRWGRPCSDPTIIETFEQLCEALEMSDENPRSFEFYKDGVKVGATYLVQEDLSEEELMNLFKLGTLNKGSIEQTLQQNGSTLMSLTFNEASGEGNQPAYMQYVFFDLPNPPPYAYAFYFDLQKVSQAEIDAIVKSFNVPDLNLKQGELPRKNRVAPSLEEAKETAVCKVSRENGEQETSGQEKLDTFMTLQERDIPVTLEVLQYIESKGELKVHEWSVLVFDGEVARCFGYYEKEDGTFTYDNIPVVFSQMVRTVYPEDGIISYRLAGEDAESTMRFVQVPLDQEAIDFSLTEEEQSIYKSYKISQEDYLLAGLHPISIAKLYVWAQLQGDYETQYALYTPYQNNPAEGMGWSKEEHLKIERKEENKEAILAIMGNVAKGIFVEQNEQDGYIAYTNYNEETHEPLSMGFKMTQNEKGIWKVDFMPIQ